MDLRRLRLGEGLAGISGAALLGSLFLPWYGFSSFSGRTSDAWEAFGAIDVVLAVVALMAIALAVMTVVHPTAAVPIALASLLSPIGLVATGLLIYRVISPPDLEVILLSVGKRTTGYTAIPETREAGLWIGLAACVGATVAGIYSMRDEGFPQAVREAARVEVESLPAPPPEGAQGRRS